MVPALEGTLEDLGIDLSSQENVTLDLEERPEQEPTRLFARRSRCPDRVVLVIQPIAGRRLRALFHEGGHTEHFAHTSRDLRWRRSGSATRRHRGLGDALQHLTDEPEWLTRRLDFPRPNEYAVEGATGLLYFVRRYAAKILYEIEFHAAEDVTDDARPYAELLSDALKIERHAGELPRGHRLRLLCASYLRSWRSRRSCART